MNVVSRFESIVLTKLCDHSRKIINKYSTVLLFNFALKMEFFCMVNINNGMKIIQQFIVIQQNFSSLSIFGNWLSNDSV